MTLIYEPDLEIVNVYLHIKVQCFQKLEHIQRETQTDTLIDATKRVTR